jgi:hypothetical protein
LTNKNNEKTWRARKSEAKGGGAAMMDAFEGLGAHFGSTQLALL